MNHSDTPVIVYGDGSAALFLISQLVQQNQSVIWASGSGARTLPVMPYVKSELALGALLSSKKILNDEAFANPVEKGIFHRVFRNKAFKLPTWKRTASVETQTQAYDEMVWGPEKTALGVHELRIAGLSPALVEQELRVLFENHSLVTRIENLPIVEIEIFAHGGKVQFANGPTKNGQIYEFSHFYFCDAISELKSVPKLASVFKHQLGTAKMNSRASALQVVFQHSEPLNQTIDTGLVISMNRDAGDTFDRDVLGYFLNTPMADGSTQYRSVWTVFLQATEVEENHEIMKKLRKMKQALNKAFDSPEFLPEGKKDFMATVKKEQVHFEEGFIVTEGHFKPSKQNSDFLLVTDAFGFSAALEKIAEHFSIAPAEYAGEIIMPSAADDFPEAPQHAKEHENQSELNEAP